MQKATPPALVRALRRTVLGAPQPAPAETKNGVVVNAATAARTHLRKSALARTISDLDDEL